MKHHNCDNKLILDKFTQSTLIFQALGDVNRQQIIALLIELTSLNVTQITERMEISRPAVSHHLKILRQAHLVDYVHKGKERFYFLSSSIPDALQVIKSLIEAIESESQRSDA